MTARCGIGNAMACRLTDAALAGLPHDIARPAFDRARLRPGIVHLGIGAFHRAHQAMINDLAMPATRPGRWGLVGISMRSPDTHDALPPQSGLYAVALRDAGPVGAPRESLSAVGSVLRVLLAPDDPGAAVARIAHPDTRI